MRCRIDALPREILAVVKLTCIGRRLDASRALSANSVAIAKVGERRRLDEHQAFHCSRRLIGEDELVRLDAQVGVLVTRIRFGDDDAFHDHGLGLVVIGGKRGLIKVKLREVEAECAQNRREGEDENPARLGRAPGAEIAAAMLFCADPADAPIFASAILARPDIVLSNDFEAFHTPKAKVLWQEHHTTVESLYGLPCALGRRKRMDMPDGTA